MNSAEMSDFELVAAIARADGEIDALRHELARLKWILALLNREHPPAHELRAVH